MPEPITLTALALSAVLVAVFAYKTVDTAVKAPGQTIEKGADAAKLLIETFGAELRSLFGAAPQLSLNKVVLQKAPMAICELCLAKAEVRVEAQVQGQWLGSAKRLAASQTFAVKAGYDLNRLKCNLDTENKRLEVTISEATIVNVVPLPDLTFDVEDHGWWNRITKEDRAQVINALPVNAGEKAGSLGVYALAEAQLKIVLERLLKDFSITVKVTRLDDTIVFEESRGLKDLPDQAKSRLGLIEDRRACQTIPASG